MFYNTLTFLILGKNLTIESLAILEPPESNSKKRKYKPRENCFVLSTPKHRASKDAAAKKKQPTKKSVIRTNCEMPPSDAVTKCKFCNNDLNNIEGVKRMLLVKCVSCKNWMHEKCIPKRAKMANPYVAMRIIAGVKFDFICCVE
jgi:hypothetical protein